MTLFRREIAHSSQADDRKKRVQFHKFTQTASQDHMSVMKTNLRWSRFYLQVLDKYPQISWFVEAKHTNRKRHKLSASATDDRPSVARSGPWDTYLWAILVRTAVQDAD